MHLLFRFPSQCRSSAIAIPQYAKEWINIKQVFANQYGIWPKGMIHMLSYLKIPMEGRHHSGIDDCRNITKVVQQLIRDKAKFEITSTIQ